MALNLVNYSDSSSDESDKDHKSEEIVMKITKNKLPNPFEKPDKVNEADNLEHNGRTRLFPHERGNWATYVYIHCDKTDAISQLQDDLLDLLRCTDILESIQFHPLEELHMSVTRTVVLRHHWIDEFTRSIENSVKNTNRFWVNLNSIEFYCNDNQSRTFIGLSNTDTKSMSLAKQNLQSIVQKLDNCLEEFKLPAFYEEASFHVSLLWCLGDKRNELQLVRAQIHEILERLSAEDDTNFALNVERLFCKIGNKLFNFPL